MVAQLRRLLRSRILRRILFGYALVATLLGVGLKVASQRFNALNDAFATLIAHDVALIDEAEQLERLVDVMREAERAYVRTGDAEFRARFENTARALPVALSRVERAVRGRRREQAQVAALRDTIERWLAGLQHALALRDAVTRGELSELEAESRLRGAEGAADARSVVKGLQMLHAAALAGVEAWHRSALDASAATRRDTALMMILAAVVAIAYGTFVARDLGTGLAALQGAMEALGRGVAPSARSTRRDEIGDVTHTFEDLAQRLGAAESELRAQVEAQARLVAEQRETNVALAHAMRVKGDFVAKMSHELRTPLNAVIGLAALLLDSPREQLSPRARQALETMRDSGTHLLGMLNDLLDLARLDAGRMDFAPVAVDCAAVARSCVATTVPLIGERAVEIALDAEPDLRCRADPQRLRQVLLNLLSNAVKFTPAGRIAVRVYRAGDAARIDVEDTGIGIAPSSHEAVFEQFYQEARGDARSHGGAGLGLVLARQMARAMGGDVALTRSAPGEGSVFTITLPLATEE